MYPNLEIEGPGPLINAAASNPFGDVANPQSSPLVAFETPPKIYNLKPYVNHAPTNQWPLLCQHIIPLSQITMTRHGKYF